MALTPLGEIVGLRDREDVGAARALASRIRIQLLAEGYGPTLSKWVHDLAPWCDARQVQRLLQLVELGHRWDERATLRPTDFTRYVACESVEDPSSARVQVMTIHQSKGLEFDAVVLPELYASLAPDRGEELIPKRDPDTGRVVQVYPGMSKEKLALFPEAKPRIRSCGPPTCETGSVSCTWPLHVRNTHCTSSFPQRAVPRNTGLD